MIEMSRIVIMGDIRMEVVHPATISWKGIVEKIERNIFISKKEAFFVAVSLYSFYYIIFLSINGDIVHCFITIFKYVI